MECGVIPHDWRLIEYRCHVNLICITRRHGVSRHDHKTSTNDRLLFGCDARRIWLCLHRHTKDCQCRTYRVCAGANEYLERARCNWRFTVERHLQWQDLSLL